MLRRFYRAAKLVFVILVQRMINRAQWVDERADNLPNLERRRAIRRIVRKIGDIGQFLLQFPRLDAVRITGEIGSVIYVGETDTYKLSLMKALFNDVCEEQPLGRVAVWNLSSRTRQWSAENDLVICRVSRFFPWRIRATYAFNNILRVYQMIPLDKPPEAMIAGSSHKRIREHINHIRKANITTVESTSEEDLEFFYHRMYVPTMSLRHHERAVIAPYESLARAYQSGFLFFLVLDGHKVAGSLCYLSKNGVFTGAFLGYLDGKNELLKQDLGVALYWNTMLKARECGATMMSIMESCAWVSNGIYNHKQRWGARPYPDPYNHQQFLFRANRLSDAWRLHLNTIGFLTCENDHYLRIYVGDSEVSSDVLCEEAAQHGLHGIQIVTANQCTNILVKEPSS